LAAVIVVQTVSKETGSHLEMNEERDTGARLWHPWLRINRVLRLMLHTRWSAESWSVVRLEFRKAVALRSRILREDGLTERQPNLVRLELEMAMERATDHQHGIGIDRESGPTRAAVGLVGKSA
jgi:hypothetical protein